MIPLAPIAIGVALVALAVFSSDKEDSQKTIIMKPGERWKLTLQAGSVENRDQSLSVLESVGAEVKSVDGPKATIIMTNGAEDFELNVPGALVGFPGVSVVKATKVSS